MFLLVISVNHTNTRFKVSLWILLTGKSAGFQTIGIPQVTQVAQTKQRLLSTGILIARMMSVRMLPEILRPWLLQHPTLNTTKNI
jgi:hypothetical protein